MGLMSALFGGGTKLELKLDAAEVPAGGQLSGQITVMGGKKPLRINALFVRLLLVSVHSKEGSAVPDVDTRLLVDSTIATNEDLPAGERRRYTFRFPVPTGLEPTNLGISYTVLAQADIPGVADPKSEAKLRVIEARGEALLTLAEVLERYPELRSSDADEVVSALYRLHGDCYSERERLIAVEPVLVELVREAPNAQARRQAFATWANLVDNQVRKEHLSFLAEMANEAEDTAFFREIVTAAAKFAEEGALPMVQKLARHPEAEVRLNVVQQLRFNSARRFSGKRELIDALAKDPDSRVRAAAIEAWSEWRDEPALIRAIAALCDSDPTPEVQSAVISVLSLAHNYGGGSIALDLYERHVTSPHVEVRKTIAESLQWLPESEITRIQALVGKLLSDSSGEVRETMAFQLQNLSELKSLVGVAQKAFENDPSESVRHEALTGLCAMLDPKEACRICERVLAQTPSEPMLWGVLGGLRHHRESPEAKPLLMRLASSGTCVASAAQDELVR